ncbi:hypothetical protein EQM13_13740 [Acidilutibacter cellobiosedens]|jgi:hypothetical protein|uniref:DUF4351 domain-containing protein n=1 Tax=Acidilutibacter cellobiosedens TaxID=2507161 RepID=A0A410QEW6_9FIRM|nr:hypothetical protein [Acidilutibacter cellobiosedens]QAT62550.1 hypothetical protein EQM13_13740 [Acidilutibacter cellobiosedens]
MKADFKQKSFIEGYFNRIFKGLSFEEFGLDLPAVKEVVEVEQIENYKKPLLMLLLEDETILHIEFINDKIKPNIESMMIYDANICIKYGIQVTTVILYSGSEQKGKLKTDSGSIHYEAQIICLSEFNGEEIYSEIEGKIHSGSMLSHIDKSKLIFLPFMYHSLPLGEALSKVLSLIEALNEEEEQLAYMTVITEIVSRFTGNKGIGVVKEYLMDTEVGVRIKDEGIKEGMQNSLLIILLHKFNSLPDNLYFAITNQQNENILMEWLRKVSGINTIDELERMVFSRDRIKE